LIEIAVTPVANAGPDQNLCLASSVNLTGNDGSTGSWTCTLIPGTESPTITPTSTFSAVVTGLTSGTYRFKYSITSCAPPSEDFVDVTIFSATDAANAGANQQFCGANSLGPKNMMASRVLLLIQLHRITYW